MRELGGGAEDAIRGGGALRGVGGEGERVREILYFLVRWERDRERETGRGYGRCTGCSFYYKLSHN